MIRPRSVLCFPRAPWAASAWRPVRFAAPCMAGITLAVAACAGPAIPRRLPQDTPAISKDTAATPSRVPAVHQVAVPAGRIGGIVLVRTTLQPAVRAMTFLEGSGTVDHTDSSGTFLLPEAAPGTHTLVIRALGCFPETQRVRVTPDQGTAVLVLLAPVPFELKSISVGITPPNSEPRIRTGITTPDTQPTWEQLRVCPR